MNKPAKYLFCLLQSVDFQVRAHRNCLITASGKNVNAEMLLLSGDYLDAPVQCDESGFAVWRVPTSRRLDHAAARAEANDVACSVQVSQFPSTYLVSREPELFVELTWQEYICILIRITGINPRRAKAWSYMVRTSGSSALK